MLDQRMLRLGHYFQLMTTYEIPGNTTHSERDLWMKGTHISIKILLKQSLLTCKELFSVGIQIISLFPRGYFQEKSTACFAYRLLFVPSLGLEEISLWWSLYINFIQNKNINFGDFLPRLLGV